MRSLCFGLFLLYAAAVPAQTSQGTTLGSLLQTSEPAMLISTHHTLTDALAGATLRNQGKVPITSYRVGWVLLKDGKTSVHETGTMSVPSGVQPGGTVEVPDQTIPLDTAARSFLFYVSEVTYADGTKWSADAEALLKQVRAR